MSLVLLFVITSLLPGSVCQIEPASVDDIVREFREFPTKTAPLTRPDGTEDPVEKRRFAAFARLSALGESALPAISRALLDDDVRVRVNVAYFLIVVSNGYTEGVRRLNIETSLPALTQALSDSHWMVRTLAARAVGTIGPRAASAVPALMVLLNEQRIASRHEACFALKMIGPAASDALPRLRVIAGNDPNELVRHQAQGAIYYIEGRLP